MKDTAQKLRNLLFLIFLFLFPFQPVTYGGEMIHVAVLPFRINSEEDLGYMKRGIRDMMASRISIEGKVVVLDTTRVKEALSQIEEEPITEEAVRKTGGPLDVDFIVSGSITKIGENVSIDAKIFDIKEKNSVTSLLVTSKGMDNVIAKINDLALKASARIMAKVCPERSVLTPCSSSRAADFMSEFLNPEMDEKKEER